jgi:hypothetical protein
MKISLIHPSRGRALKSFMNSNEWISKAGNVEVELIVGVDVSDETQAEYIKHYGAQVVIFPSSSVVEATNFAAQRATGDILVYLSDDFKCPDNWGELIVKEFENENRPLLIKVDDCLQAFHKAIVTIPIMNRALYQKLGYFWHPAYKSMFVDEDIYWTAQSIGALKMCAHLKFPHHHYSNPDDNIRADRDEVYKRSEANWDQGKETFKRRKLQKFMI